ncbi:unnamed protein product, partial [Phaeothamnion confervicola]
MMRQVSGPPRTEEAEPFGGRQSFPSFFSVSNVWLLLGHCYLLLWAKFQAMERITNFAAIFLQGNVTALERDKPINQRNKLPDRHSLCPALSARPPRRRNTFQSKGMPG